MSDTTATETVTDATRSLAIGDQVPVPLSGTLGSITGLSGQFCASCHCCPPNPDHHGDGSLCCPGPWYRVTYTCDECRHAHTEIYAEHELTPAT